MDVKCSHCSTEYEFDDSRVKGGSVTVKCSSCGHVFKVTAPSSIPESSSSASDKSAVGDEWVVKRRNGKLVKFKELTTLQKWIVEQKVDRVDLISKSGRNWKSLGEIAELASFFQVVEAANAASAQVTMPSVLSAPLPKDLLPSPVVAAPGSSGVADAGLEGHAPGGAEVPKVSQSSSSDAMGSARSFIPTADPVATSPERSQSGPEQAWGSSDDHDFFRPGDDDDDFGSLDDDDPVLMWKRRRRNRTLTAFFLVVLVVVGGAFAAFAPEQFRALLTKVGVATGAGKATLAAPDSSALFAQVQLVLAQDDAAVVRASIVDLEKRTAAPAGDAETLAARARLHADLTWRHAVVVQLLKRAKASAGDVEVAVAAREKELATARELVGGAQNAKSNRPSVFLAEGAIQAAAAKKTKMLEAFALLKQVDEKGGFVVERNALDALATALLALPNPTEDAIAKVAEALKAAPTDARLQHAALVLAALQALAPAPKVSSKSPKTQQSAAARKVRLAAIQKQIQAQQQVAASDPRWSLLAQLLTSSGDKNKGLAGTKPKAGAEAGNGKEGRAQARAAQQAHSDPRSVSSVSSTGHPSGGGAATKLSYAKLLRKAERLRVSDHTNAAKRLYKQALELKPGGAKALVGLGWCELDNGRASAAARKFRKAIARNPDLGVAHFGLGEALNAAGDKKGAKKAYNDYLFLDPGGSDAAYAKRAIERL